MSTKNGRSRKLQTVRTLENADVTTEPMNEADGSVENLSLNEEAASTEEIKSSNNADEAIASSQNQQTASASTADAQASSATQQYKEVAQQASGENEDEVDPRANSSEQHSSQRSSQASAEEVLRAAKKASQQGIGHSSSESDSAVPNQPQAEQQCDDITPASSQITESTTATAAVLVELAQQASEKRFETGFERGQQQAREIQSGTRLGVLYGLAEAELNDTQDLAEQLKLLGQHTDHAIAQRIEKRLGAITPKSVKSNEDPLGEWKNKAAEKPKPFRIL